MNKQIFSRILTDLAEKEIPAQGDPWTKIRSHFGGDFPVPENPVQKRFPQKRFSYGMGAAFFGLSLLVIYLISPAGQVIAARITQFFIPVEQDSPSQINAIVATQAPLELVDVNLSQPAVEALAKQDDAFCNGEMNRACTLAAAQKQVEFPLQQFGSLPEGLYFTSAAIENNRVTALYQCPSGCDLWLEQQKLNGAAPDPAQVGADALIIPVAIGQDVGEYIQGTYTGENGVWDSTADTYFLRWQHGDILYTISAVWPQLGEAPLTQPAQTIFTALATSLTPDLSLTLPLNPAYLTSIGDAQILSGIQVEEPAWLPDGYRFVFATFDASSEFVCLNYAYNGAWYPSLFIRESVTSAISQLQPASETELAVENLTIANTGIEAQYVTGFLAPADACGGADALFRTDAALLWRTPFRTFEIYSELPAPAGGPGLDQQTLLNMASGLTGAVIPAETDVELNHIDSISAAEDYTGYSLKTPTRLPAGSGFEYAAIELDSVRTVYGGSADNLPELTLHQCPAVSQSSVCADLIDSVPAAYRTAVAINGMSAVYAKGELGSTPAQSIQSWHVQDPANTERLFWQSDGWNFVLVSTGVDVNTDLLIAIAASVQ
jgi:hypothetical protein